MILFVYYKSYQLKIQKSSATSVGTRIYVNCLILFVLLMSYHEMLSGLVLPTYCSFPKNKT